MNKECAWFNFSEKECSVWQLMRAGLTDVQICKLTRLTPPQLESFKFSIQRKQHFTNEAAKEARKRKENK